MTPTRQEELQAFYQQVLPGFLEYLRSHQSAIEQVELATVKDGIVSFPATQILGGVLKTVRVPLSLITGDIDQAKEYAREMGDYAKAQGNYAKAQGNYAKAEGDYADEKGDYAKAQGDHAKAEGDRAKKFNDHPWEFRTDGYIWAWDEDYDNGDGTYGAMVSTNKVLIPWDEMTPEQQQQVIDNVAQGLVVASVSEAVQAVSELT